MPTVKNRAIDGRIIAALVQTERAACRSFEVVMYRCTTSWLAVYCIRFAKKLPTSVTQTVAAVRSQLQSRSSKTLASWCAVRQSCVKPPSMPATQIARAQNTPPSNTTVCATSVQTTASMPPSIAGKSGRRSH